MKAKPKRRATLAGGQLWKQIDEAAKKLLGGEAPQPTRDDIFDDIARGRP